MHGGRGCVVNFTQLEHFMQMCGEETFVAAARKAGVTSQGFTKSIRSLEAELGVPLFVRDEAGRQVPTPYAEAVRTFCERAFEARRAMADDLARARAADRASLTVAVAAGSLSLLGLDFFDGFRRAHPEVALACTNASDLDAEEAVRDGRSELAVTVLPASEGFCSRRLGASRLFAWVPAACPLAARTQLDMADMDGQHVAVVGPNYKGYQRFLELCEEGGIHPASVTALPENTMLHQFAREGRGVAFTSEHLLPMFGAGDGVVALPVRGALVEIGLAWLRDRPLSPQAMAFADYCRPRARGLAERIRELLE